MFIVIFRKVHEARAGRQFVHVGMLLCILFTLSSALTRWSAVQLVPDADLLEGGSFVLAAQGYYYSDIIKGTTVKPVGMVKFGIIEWVNIEAGYTGGFSLGIKTRILGETKPWMPSLAIGIHNIFSHSEAWLFDRMGDSLGSELYLVLGKSIEPIRLRFDIGLQSIPGSKSEQINFYGVIEKYFGLNLYVTAEVHQRDKKVHPSLFASWRFWKRRLEVSAGVVDITGMFIKDDVPPNSPVFSSTGAGFVRPGVWFGLRFKGSLKFGKTDGLNGIESSLYSNAASINELRGEVDSLKQLLQSSSVRLENMNRSLSGLTDSTMTDSERLKALATDRLAILNTLYAAEPFEPEAVNRVMSELVANRDRMLPSLYSIVYDPIQESKIRTLAITALGEIGTPAAADVIIEALGKSPNTEMTIECLIALGKMKETRAVYLMQQLSNNPNDDIAFTAAEVLQKLEKETGISVTPVPAAVLAPESIPEKQIGSGQTYEQKDAPAADPALPETVRQSEWKMVSPAVSDSGLKKIEPAEFMEATVAKEPAGTKTVPPQPAPVQVAPTTPEPPPLVDSRESASGIPRTGESIVAQPDSVPAVADEQPAAPAAAPEVRARPPENSTDQKTEVKPVARETSAGKKAKKPRRERSKIDLSKDTW
jgi:hypothetical protein